ncbi:hypothetical protein AB0G35_24060 [Streptomyces sp. NPDC021749]|uniref:hypothetical protein n=1 Tax=Streptomyces sp. NPDC021749 TaxID=3154905 RepID=UPI0033C6D36A
MGKPQKKPGVRIPWVRDARGDDYDRSAIDIKPHPPYVIPLSCGGCGVQVSARSANADDPDSRASHYFTMPGRKHKATCNFDLPRRGKELVNASQGTIVRREGQWRLKCPPLARPGTRGGAKGGNAPPRPARTTVGGGKTVVSKLRGPAIASAKRIVQLLESFKHDPETVAQFAAVAPSGRRNIPWDEFCLGPATAHQLAQKLVDGTVGQIPHAVWGPASTAGPAGQRGASHVVMYAARHPVLIEGRRVKVNVAVRCKVGEWIGADTSSGMFLGYGYWEPFPKGADWAHEAAERGWVELQLWVKEPWQVERWDTNGTATRRPKRPARLAPPKPGPGPAPESRTDRPTPAQPPHPAPQPQETDRPPALPSTPPQNPTEQAEPAPAPATPDAAGLAADAAPQQGVRTDTSQASRTQHAEELPSAPKPQTPERADPLADGDRSQAPEHEAEASLPSSGPAAPPPPPYPPVVPSPRPSRVRGWLNRLRGR